MKKEFILALVFVMAACCLSAQSLSTLATDICDPRASVGMVSKTLEGDETTHFLYSEDFFASSSKQQKTDALFAINAANAEVTQASVTHPANIDFLDAFENEDEVIAFYTEENKNDGMITLYMNKVSKNEGSPAWEPSLLNTFPYEKRDKVYTKMAVSPDKSKVALCYMSSAKKGDIKGAVVMTFDNNGERIWDRDIELDFSNRTFQVLDMVITNDAQVYVPMISYVIPGKNMRTDDKLHIYELTQKHINTRSENIGFGYITSGRMIQTRDGNLCLAGFYLTNMKDNESGSYMVKYDARYSSFINMSHQNFPSSYKEKTVSKSSTNTFANQMHKVTADKLVEFDNGNLSLLGEQRTLMSKEDDKGITTYSFYAKNIVFITADENADIKDFKMFSKNQAAAMNSMDYSYEDLGLSYYAFFHNNKFYMLYSDNIDNYMGMLGQQIVISSKNKHCTSMLVVDETGESTTSLVINSKVANGRMLAPLFIEDDGFVIIFEDKKTVSICKLNVEL